MNASRTAKTLVRRRFRFPMIIGLKAGAWRDVAGAMMMSESSGLWA